jgi:hypothetical protein
MSLNKWHDALAGHFKAPDAPAATEALVQHLCPRCGSRLPQLPSRIAPIHWALYLVLLVLGAALVRMTAAYFRGAGLFDEAAWALALFLFLALWAISGARARNPRFRCHVCKHRGRYRDACIDGAARAEGAREP